jgi:hypothetical protein
VVVTINIIEGISKTRLIINNIMPNNFFFCLNDLKTNVKRIIPAKNNKSMKIKMKIELIFLPPSTTIFFFNFCLV